MANKLSRSILITGVSSGIGMGTAKAFIRRDYRVFGSVRKEEDARRLERELGSNFFTLVFDVTDVKAIAHTVETVARELGGEGLGGLINNAGVAIGGPLMHQPLGVIREHFEVNVIGLLAVTQAFLPLLGARAGFATSPGRIINIGSVAGKVATPFVGAYVGSKHAVEGISATLRRELLLYGIDVIVIGPGAVNTPIWDKGSNSELYVNTDYYRAIDGFVKFFVAQGRKGFSIDEIGEKIARIFEKRKPKTRYALVPNKLQGWIIPRLLPDRMLDKVIGKQTGLLK